VAVDATSRSKKGRLLGEMCLLGARLAAILLSRAVPVVFYCVFVRRTLGNLNIGNGVCTTLTIHCPMHYRDYAATLLDAKESSKK